MKLQYIFNYEKIIASFFECMARFLPRKLQNTHDQDSVARGCAGRPGKEQLTVLGAMSVNLKMCFLI